MFLYCVQMSRALTILFLFHLSGFSPNQGRARLEWGLWYFHIALFLSVHFVYFILFQFCIGFDMLTGFTFTGSSVPP